MNKKTYEIKLRDLTLYVPREEFYEAAAFYKGLGLTKLIFEAEPTHEHLFIALADVDKDQYVREMYEAGRGLGHGDNLAPRRAIL